MAIVSGLKFLRGRKKVEVCISSITGCIMLIIRALPITNGAFWNRIESTFVPDNWEWPLPTAPVFRCMGPLGPIWFMRAEPLSMQPTRNMRHGCPTTSPSMKKRTWRKSTLPLGSSRRSLEWPIFMLLDIIFELLHELCQLIFLNFPCRRHSATGSTKLLLLTVTCSDRLSSRTKGKLLRLRSNIIRWLRIQFPGDVTAALTWNLDMASGKWQSWPTPASQKKSEKNREVTLGD